MKIAFVHDYLHTYGGAERVLEAMHEVYPDAPIFTALYVPQNLPDSFPHEAIQPISPTRNRLLKALSKQLSFLYPLFFETIRLDEYDLVISSTAGFAKGVVTHSRQKHICYCHTPPRFLYAYESESKHRMAWYYAPFVSVLDSYFRVWDFAAAQRVSHFFTNSHNTARRIKKFYRRDATVLYPPVLLPSIVIDDSPREEGKFFLVVSRLASYKHVELAITAAQRLGISVKIVGRGPQEQSLKKLAGETVEFLGFVSDTELARLYAEAEALIYTAPEEDFGITPIEAMHYGCPVIGHRSGGLPETVVPGETGELFAEYSVEGLVDVLDGFEKSRYDEERIKEQAKLFSKERFQKEFEHLIESDFETLNSKSETPAYAGRLNK